MKVLEGWPRVGNAVKISGWTVTPVIVGVGREGTDSGVVMEVDEVTVDKLLGTNVTLGGRVWVTLG